ncbi:A disintegrin and metalloproteinase with thrombospondin motifs 20-like isoform X1 [Tachysurus ichikawai]
MRARSLRRSTGYGECLLDEPVGRSYDLPVKLPGQIYNANRQCELMFGPGSQVCPFMRQCKRLWCTSSEGDHKGCRTQHMPLADGTECGHGMAFYKTFYIKAAQKTLCARIAIKLRGTLTLPVACPRLTQLVRDRGGLQKSGEREFAGTGLATWPSSLAALIEPRSTLWRNTLQRYHLAP